MMKTCQFHSEETKVFNLQGIYCVGRSLHCLHSTSAKAKPQGCRFTSRALSRGWLHVSECAHISAAFGTALDAHVGTGILFDVIFGKAEGEEQKTKTNER